MKKFRNILSLIFTTIFILISINCYNDIINRYSDEAVPSINNYSSAMDYKLNFSEATSLEKVNYTKTS